MNLLPYRIALQSLRMNHVRTGLTTLGIVIGVASVTFILSLGSGVENSVKTEVGKLSNNIILVTSGAESSLVETAQRYNPYGIGATTSLTEEDYMTIRLNPNVADVAPVMILSGSVTTAQGVKANTPIVATTPSLASILHLSTKPGQFVDSSTARDTVTVGAQLATQLYGSEQLLGQQFSLKGRQHTVVGTLKRTGTPVNLSGIDFDKAVFISLDDGKSFNQGVAQVQQILVTVKDPSKLEPVRTDIGKALLANHKDEHDFTVFAGQNVAEHGNASFRAVVIMTTLVATVTLIVGGIGIMNIMLVGVTERTREIGIRKALGATNAHVLSQFLIEALIMCVVGGFAGLAVGYALAFLVALQLSFQAAITLGITLTGLGMAFATGVLFGLYPAVKAARKDPIESLRQYH